MVSVCPAVIALNWTREDSADVEATPWVVVTVGAVNVAPATVAAKFVTLALAVALVKVTADPDAAALVHPLRPPEKLPTEVLPFAFVAAPLTRLANAVATWAAVAPLTPAVKVRPPTVADWPAVNALKVTAAVSVADAATVTGAD